MFKKFQFIFLLLLFSTIFAECTCKNKSKVDFTVEEKQLYDSLKIIAFKDIRNNTDRICGNIKDSLFNKYVDSLLTLRRAEIQQLFEE
jgi:hypothetical protein